MLTPKIQLLSGRLRWPALLLPLLLASCGEAPQMAPPGTPTVSVVTLEAAPVTLTRELPGRTRPFLIAEVRPQVTGIVRERLFVEGSRVEAGDALYQLDDAIYRANFNSARAALARAEAAAEIARLNARRAEQLIKDKIVSEQEYQSILATRDESEAEVGVQKANLERAAVQLDYARIESPIAGVTGKSSVTKGALVTADQANLLTTVQQLDPMYVDLTQSASELMTLRRELSASEIRQAASIPVAILREDGSEYPHRGELIFSDAAVDPTTGSVAFRVVVPNPDQELLPGMYVRAVVSKAVLESAILVPQESITRNAKGQAVAMTVSDDGTVEQRTVSVSDTIGDKWLVSGGLSEGDRVVVAGLQKIRPGMTVQTVSAETPAE